MIIAMQRLTVHIGKLRLDVEIQRSPNMNGWISKCTTHDGHGESCHVNLTERQRLEVLKQAAIDWDNWWTVELSGECRSRKKELRGAAWDWYQWQKDRFDKSRRRRRLREECVGP